MISGSAVKRDRFVLIITRSWTNLWELAKLLANLHEMQISDSFIVGGAIVQIIEGQYRGNMGRKLWYVDLWK